MIEIDALQEKLRQLPKKDRLKIAHWLLDSLVETAEGAGESPAEKNPLLKWAGMFNGGPGDTAQRVEENLGAEIGNVGGFGDS